MEIASERCLIVTEGDVRSDTLQRHITPDELFKDIRSTKRDVYKSDEVPTKSKESSRDITVRPVFSKVDVVQYQTEKVSPIKEDLPEKRNIERKALPVSRPEEAYHRSLVEHEASEHRAVKNQITAGLPAEEIRGRQKQTDITDAETESIRSKTSKSLREKALKLDTRCSGDVQSESGTVTGEYGSFAPLEETETELAERVMSVSPVTEVAAERHQVVKDGDMRSDTLHRRDAPDTRAKDVGSSREDAYESSEASLESTKGRVQAEKQQITDADNTMLTEQKHTRQPADASAVAQQETRTLRGDQERSTMKSIRCRTDTAKDLFLSAAPRVETKQDRVERKASRTPVMDVAYEKPLIMKQHEFKFDTPQRFITPDDLVKDMTSSRTQSVEVPLKKDEHTTGTSPTSGRTEELRAQERKSKAGTLVDKTTKVTPIHTTATRGLLRGEDTLDRSERTGETTQTESFKKALNQSDTIEGIQPKVVMVTDKRAAVSPPEGTEIKRKQIERKATVTPAPWKESLIADEYTKREMLKDVRTMSAEQDFKYIEERPKCVSFGDQAAKQQLPVSSHLEAAPLERQPAEPRDMKTGVMVGTNTILKELPETEKLEIRRVQIKGDQFLKATQTILEKQKTQEISGKYQPAATESSADIGVIGEPSVTDTTEPKTVQEETTELGESVHRKSEVERSCLKADVRYLPPQEVLTLTPEGKEGVTLQESSRGIEGDMLCVTEHVFYLSTTPPCAPPP
ncbi:hypothetical protein CesoFtcFv8_013377 [Champsocephalus esox]|uniref:Uncharacterized protein n=1 Tax=Champsocephalus esox TaxID=159716 RepID=A0AAN8GTN0_9TELE|nr:hypothetical protein CesoFtcFv8_013377 [Champsocephalus esox]